MQVRTETTSPLLLISNFRRVLNVVFFLLSNLPVSEFYVPTFGTPCLFHLHRWCEQEEFFPLTPPMKMKQCSETSARKIQQPGNPQKKECNFSIIRSCKGCVEIANIDLSKRSYFWSNYFSPAPNLVPVQGLCVDRRQAYSRTNPVHCYSHYQYRFTGFANPNLVTLNKLCNRSTFWQTCCCLMMHESP